MLEPGKIYNFATFHRVGHSNKAPVRKENVMYTGVRLHEEDFIDMNIPSTHYFERYKLPKDSCNVQGSEIKSPGLIRRIAVCMPWEQHTDGVKKYFSEVLMLAFSNPDYEMKEHFRAYLLNHILPAEHLHNLGKTMGYSEKELSKLKSHFGKPTDKIQEAVIDAFEFPINLYIPKFHNLEQLIR